MSSGANNAIAKKPRFSVAITTDTYQQMINNTLGDPARAKNYIAAITSAVAVNKDLQDCEASTILAGSLLGESLNLVHSPQAGHYYLVPFENKKTGVKTATFVLGYKGYIQLALRSGQYKKLNVQEIKAGELIKYDPVNEEFECKIIEDYEERESAPTIGYFAMFEYINGFRKILYWSKEKMLAHAHKYSPAFSAPKYEMYVTGQIPEKDLYKYSSFWYKDFDGMAKKTMLRQLISKWGIMSVEMATAFEADNTIKTTDKSGNIIDVEAEEEAPEAPTAEVVEVNIEDIEI